MAISLSDPSKPWSFEFEKIDTYALLQEGLRCLQYNDLANPNEAQDVQGPVDIFIGNQITNIEAIDDLKKVSFILLHLIFHNLSVLGNWTDSKIKDILDWLAIAMAREMYQWF